MHAPNLLDRMMTTHVVSTAAALDSLSLPEEALALRVAADELLILPPQDALDIADEYAIVELDGSWAGGWFSAEEAQHILERHCEWEPPAARPAFAQGMVAGIPTKLWFETDRVLLLVSAPYSAEMENRLAH